MKIALIGYGKMGKAIQEVILQDYPQDEIILCIDETNRATTTIDQLRQADVAIEFTRPEAVVDNIYWCMNAGIPIVVGTTAWLDRLAEVTARCEAKNGAVFHAPNYSIGVNLFLEVNKRLAELMNHQPQYRVTMEEVHHTQKLDAPSGTAIKTAEAIIAQLDTLSQWRLTENGTVGAGNDLLITAKRAPDVPGTHTVRYQSTVDEITITHQAYSRRGFAEGAIAAARWLIGRKGMYEMKDLLAR
jgi:4-hydroxy-tetrahydrodipicolinate reductase